MTEAHGNRQKNASNSKKEEKMNARKVLVICALVVGLATALEVTAFAGPPRVEYWLGERPIYGADGGPVAPKVSVPLYQAENSQLPSFYRGWSSVAGAEPSAAKYLSWNDLIYDYDLPDNVVQIVKWPTYEYSDPLQVGGYDPWDPIGNAFGVAQSLQATTPEGVWDDDGIPNNTAPIPPWSWPEWSDPAQPGGYDPWDPLGNAFGLVGKN